MRRFPFIRKGVVGAACFLLAAGAAAAGHNTYIADPSTGLIYAVPFNSSDGTPVVISGSTSFSAEMLVHAGPGLVAYVPEGTAREIVAAANLQSGQLFEVLNTGNGGIDERVVALGTGIADGTFIALTKTNTGSGTHRLYVMEIDGDTGAWSAAQVTEEFAVVTPRGAPPILQLAEDKFGIVQYEFAPETTVLVVDTSESPLTVHQAQIDQLMDPFALRAPNDTWVVGSRPGGLNSGEQILFAFDFEANPAAVPADWNDQFDQTRIRHSQWQETRESLSLLTREELWTWDAPFVGIEPEIIWRSRNPENQIDPSRDITGADSLHRTGETTWDTYDEVLGHVYTLSEGASQRDARFVLEAGDGPPFGEIIDIAAAPNGLLYVLTSDNLRHAIFRVRPADGSREILCQWPSSILIPRLILQDDGTLSTVEQIFQPDPETPGRMNDALLVRSFDPSAAEPCVPVRQIVVTDPFCHPVAGALPGSDIFLANICNFLPASYRATSDSTSTLFHYLPDIDVLTPEYTGPNFEPEFVYEAEFTFPTELHGIGIPQLIIEAQWLTSRFPIGNEVPEFRIIRGDQTWTVDPVRKSSTLRDDGKYQLVYHAGIRFPETVTLDGPWTIEIPYRPPMNGDIWHSLDIFAKPVKQLQHARLAPDGTLALLESFPLALVRAEPESQLILSRTTLDPPNFVNIVSGFALVPGSNDILVAPHERPAVYRLNPDTGESHIEIDGRPGIINPTLLGIDDMLPHWIITTGPGIPLGDGVPGGWMLR